MSAYLGITPIADLTTGAPTSKQKVARVRALIPDVMTPDSSGAQAGGGFLDEMSPAAAVQLRVELVALEASIP